MARAKQPKEDKPIKTSLTKEDIPKVIAPWEYEDNYFDEIEVSHLVEFLTADQRIHFVNEAHRVLKPFGKIMIITPFWCANGAYGDLSVQWPPVTESWYPHLQAKWRKENNPTETRYTCDFDPSWGFGMHPLISTRNQEYQQHAIVFWKEAAQTLMATLTKNG